jgi:hypothetical protein
MGVALFSMGLMLIISIIVMVISTIVGLFVGQIILFESIGIAIAAGCLVSHFFHIHPVFCILIGLAVLVSLFYLMNTKIGFWLIGGLMSLLWGLLVTVFVFSGTGKDMVWTYASWAVASLIVFALHFKAKSKVTN